jgi:hypothetical protein
MNSKPEDPIYLFTFMKLEKAKKKVKKKVGYYTKPHFWKMIVIGKDRKVSSIHCQNPSSSTIHIKQLAISWKEDKTLFEKSMLTSAPSEVRPHDDW